MSNEARKYVLIAAALIAFYIVISTVIRKNPNTGGLANRYEARAAALGLDIAKALADTAKIYNALGIDMFWDDSWFPFKIPAPWEDEETVIRVVNNYPTPAEFSLLADVYDRRWNRRLREDLNYYLSAADMARIPQV